MTHQKDQRLVQREREEPQNRLPSEAELAAAADPKRAEALPASSIDIEAMLREDAMNNALPKPPALPGWHLIWLSTTNTYTPIQHYARLGYVPVKQHEMPEWQWLKQHSAQDPAGDICVNEMVLYKIPDAAYQQIMRVMHHDRPNAEAERLKRSIEEMKGGSEYRDSEGNALVKEEGDGFAQVLDVRQRRAPKFE